VDDRRPPRSSEEELHLEIAGEVQGVGFRVGLYREAQRRDVTGWVRNRSDGRVEALLQGAREDLEVLEEWCRRGPRYARVEAVEARWEPRGAKCPSFEID